MPGFITHFVFGKEAYKRFIQGDVKEAIRKYRHVFNVGLQGPDIFFYFPMFKLISKKNLGSIMHRSEVNPFFEEMLSYIIELNSIDKQILIAYLAGFYAHQTLDSTMHPYIYYFTNYMEGKKGYFAKHAKFETDIDYYLSKNKLKKHAYYFNLASSVKLTSREAMVIGEAMSTVCSKIYSVRNNKTIYTIAFQNFSYAISFFKDSSGNKIKFISKLEKLFLGNEHFTPLIIRKNHKLTSQGILNQKKEQWSNYWSKGLKSDKNFFELFDKAMNVYVSTITSFDYYIESIGRKIDGNSDIDKYKKEILNKIGNKSYRSGLSYK